MSENESSESQLEILRLMFVGKTIRIVTMNDAAKETLCCGVLQKMSGDFDFLDQNGGRRGMSKDSVLYGTVFTSSTRTIELVVTSPAQSFLPVSVGYLVLIITAPLLNIGPRMEQAVVSKVTGDAIVCSVFGNDPRTLVFAREDGVCTTTDAFIVPQFWIG